MRLGRAVATGIAEENTGEHPAVEEIHPELTLEAEELLAAPPVEVPAGR
ncbi:hypothetical protein ABT390_37515 [Streptomyces aurantiacus]|uniref:Uncharacterized protein n=1 Tax=Streptomyces aurantiacus JA 4570 TaxID=1286094 RepID=S4AN82_9ACTN|nr:hypothetical protein [Streptomyces aurantiacus]EPH42882.1 hypothetical protein STRAU_4032 [Streptomyces aurantiacus JA 4570]